MPIKHGAKYLWYCPKSKDGDVHCLPYAVDEQTLKTKQRCLVCKAQLKQRLCQCEECRTGVVLTDEERRARLNAILETMDSPNEWEAPSHHLVVVLVAPARLSRQPSHDPALN